MESDKIILNTIDWDNEDIDNKFTINSYAVDEDGNSIGLKINGFQPEFYIKLDKTSIKFISKNKSNFNIFKNNLEILSKKNLNCKLDNDKSEYDLLYDIKNYDPLDINEDSDEYDEDGNTKYKCHCLKCAPIDLFELNEEEMGYYETNFYWIKQGDFINFKDTCIIKRQDLYDGFKWDEENNTSLYFYKFIKIVFNSLRAFNTLKKNLNNTIFYKPLEKRIENKFVLINGIQLCCKEVNIDFYESNLAPLLKFFHTKKIKPCGWISIDTIHLKKIKYFNCPISYEINWNNIEPIDKLGFANFNILSWDIEADSEHGDFPQPSKQYNKQGSEIADYYLLKNKQKIKINENDILNILKKMFSYNIEELDDETINNFEYINIIHFKNSFNVKNKSKITKIYKKIFAICEKFKKEDISITKDLFYKYNKTSIKYDIEEDYNEYRENNIRTNRDKIVFHINKLLIKTFKEYVRGDRLTQIGAVFQHFGSNKLHNKFIITLGSCDTFAENCVIINTSGKSYKDIIIDTFNYDENYIKIIPFYFREEYDNDNNEELDILESSVILTYKELILQYNPDIIVAYNNFGFDNPFIMKRCEELNILKEFSKISRIINHEAKLVIKDLSSAALGENVLKLIDTKGRIHIDLLKVVQRDYNFESYKLDFIAEHFLQDNKDDISVAELFEFQKLSGEHRGRIAKYCVQDCDLLLRLLDKLSVCANNIGMANVCFVPLTYIFLRGQGVKIQSLVNKFCAEIDVLLKTLYNDPDNNDSYEGAVVLKPYAGIYLESPISVLDYASLYPSAMIGNNISHDSKVESIMTTYNSLDEIENLDFCNMRIPIIFENLKQYLTNKFDKKYVKKLMKEIPIRYQLYPLYDSIYIPEIDIRYIRFKNIYKVYDEFRDNPKNNQNLNIKNFHYTTIYFDTYKDKGKDKHKTGIKQVTYASHDNGSKGILPQILQILLSQRKLVRKQKVLEKDPFKQNILEGYQLAFKQCANSLYGQTGSKTSVISDLDLASSTTAIGRQMLNLGKSFSEEYYDCKIVYGDSITSDEPLLLMNPDGIIEIKTIASICDEEDWEQYENFKPHDTIQSNRRFKQKSYTDYKVFTNGNWNPIKKVIRHKTNKKIYRVNTHTGCIDVTEDHSLLNHNREKIKPDDLIVGKTILAHSFPNQFQEFNLLVPQQGIKPTDDEEELYTCNKCDEDRTAYYYYFNKVKSTKTNIVKQIRQKICKICVLKNMAEKDGREFDEKSIKYKDKIFTEPYQITPNEAKVWGLFMGDGSCGFYNCKSGNKYSWALNNNNIERLEYYKEILEEVEPIKFKILDTLKSSGVYKLVPYGSIKYMVDKYRPLFYDENKAKLVPTIILNAPFEIRKSYFEGYYDADGSKTGSYGLDKQINFVTKNKISALCLYYLAKSIGYNKLYINIQTKKVEKGTDYYWVSSCKKYDKDAGLVKKNIYLRTSDNEYVYDLETEHGTFNAGVGEMEVVNTDSIMISFSSKILNNISENIPLIEILNNNLDKPIDINSDDKLSKEIKGLIELMDKTKGLYKLKISILRSVVLSAEIASLLRTPHDLEYEKTFYPYILFTKKRYVGMLYELDPAIVCLKYMGIVLKRRDNANIVKFIYQGIINTIMNEHNIEKSIEFLQECLNNLLNGKYNIEDLTITKTLKSTYKNRTSIAHAVLADRISKRTGEKIASNTRIPYIFIEVPEKKGITILQGNRIETPEYVIENNLKIDVEFYITNQIKKPILQIYDLIMKHPEKIFEDTLRKIKNTKNNNVSITNWFKPVDKNVSLNTKYIIEKGCLFQIQKSKSVIQKCNKDCVYNSNYCEKHINL